MLRKRNPPKAANAATEVTIEDANGIERKNRRSISGSSRRGSWISSATSAAAAAEKAARMTGDAQPRSGASMMPKVSEASCW